MLVGRFLYGVGAESLQLSAKTIIYKWFEKTELGFPLGLIISFSRLGNVINDIVSPILSSVNYLFN